MANYFHHLTMTRRHFFGFGCAFLPGALTALRASAWTPTSPTLIVVIDDIPEDIDPALVEILFSEFIDSSIPFSCVLDTRHLEAVATGRPDQLGKIIGAFPAREAGLMEIVLTTDEGADARRYFQLRSAENQREAVAAFLSSTANATAAGRIPVVSIMDRREELSADIPAQRSAGFRVLIRPGSPGPMTMEFAGRGQMQLTGGSILRLTDPQEDTSAQLDTALSSGQDMMLFLSLADMAAVDATQLRDRIAAIATRIEAAIASGLFVAMRPMDLLFVAAPYLAADRALLLPVGDNDLEQAAIQSFVTDLRSAGLPFSLTGMEAPEWLEDADDFSPVWPDATIDPARAAGEAGAWVFSSEAPPLPTPDWAPGIVIAPGDGHTRNGLRADGRMYLRHRDWAQVRLAGDVPFDDLVVWITPGDVASPLQRQELVQELQDAVWGGRVRLNKVADLADLLLAPEPVLARLWSTQRRMVSDPPLPDALTDDARAMFLDDARLAWTFIDRFTDPETGLCAGTVSGAHGGRVNLEASLWDIASQLQGIIAASSLGIIPVDEARDRVTRMVRNLPSINLAGLTLPPAMFKTDRPADVALRGYDFCDTGRFLIALRSAVTTGLLSEADANATRNQWDLAAMVDDGHSFNLSDDQRVDVTYSHCTPYIARVFEELGLPLLTPYSLFAEQDDVDDRIRLLYSAAYIGAMGTEPLLLEAIEQGAAPEVKFLSAVLFDAQLSWYETTGQMKSVSEAPLNFEPWFIYQGLRVDRMGQEAWTFETPKKADRFQTPEFRQRAEVLSAKSAYLWAAVHPHPYCDMLVRVMRDKGRIDNLGFSVGVFTNTLEPMENYSDLNTNGIILSAIAFMHEQPGPNP